ncbi:glycoside hydrolase family 32 protein [Agromyces binzhouensis]|uniref:beta-fructofuranosidase n=1 Tax=Agromyces binzhouensis TaxID=1817495 RepID=A0A4Q2JWK7_9MICO|nr:glycoside hydrolase family 32 protein [Agromyces binzhouensis]RXZ51794.1 glycoside hydrolase family 32 protein [Agromyces binzhouensis]
MRPNLHFTARSGWINDPHGITYRDGEYHAFFQYVPDRTSWSPNCHWGHATGPDLLSLTETSVAIAPGDGDDGIWTGCLVVDGDETVIFYTATSVPDFGIGRIRAAHPVDADWLEWRKGDVVVEAPDGLDLIAFRDPFVRREASGWRMFVGAAHRDGTAMALAWTSPDLRSWTYDGVALARSTSEREPVWMGALWECPQFFQVDGVDVMVSSVWDADVLHYAGYAVGAYRDGRFDVAGWGRMTYGEGFYAPSLFFDAQGRPCLSFWIRGVADEQAGWAGAHSVPYRLSASNGALVAAPHPDVAAHRGDPAVDGRVAGLAADVEWDAADGDLSVSCGSDRLLRVVRAAGSAVVTIGDDEWTVPASDRLRIIIDGTVLELSSPAGLFAATLHPTGDALQVSASTGTLGVFPLRRHGRG